MSIIKNLTILLIVSACSLPAADLQIELTFDKRPTPCAMVYLMDDKSLVDAGAQEIKVDQKNKEFLPMMVAGSKGSKVIIHNNDDIQHNVFADDKKASVAVDLGMSDPSKDVEHKIEWDTGGVVKFGCRIHPNMQLWIAHVETKHHVCFQMSKDDEKHVATIKAAPAAGGKYRIWLPLYDEIIAEVKPGEAAQVDIMRKGKKRGVAILKLAE